MAQEGREIEPVIQHIDDAQRESAHENSAHPVVAELGLRDVGDPAPQGSRAQSPRSVHGPVMEDQPNVNQSFPIPDHGNPTRIVTSEPPRRQAEMEEVPLNTGDPMHALIQGLFNRLDQRRTENRNNREDSTDDYLKIVKTMKSLGTEKFNGSYNPLEADAWIQNLERNFEATRCLEGYKVDVAVYYLEKDATNWWRNFTTSFGNRPATWNHFKYEFRRKYFPPEARDRLEKEFTELSQDTRSVREYEVEFARLRQYAHYGPEQEDMIIRKFMRGLKPGIRSRLQVVEFRDLYDLMERAVNVEEGIA